MSSVPFEAPSFDREPNVHLHSLEFGVPHVKNELKPGLPQARGLTPHIFMLRYR